MASRNELERSVPCRHCRRDGTSTNRVWFVQPGIKTTTWVRVVQPTFTKLKAQGWLLLTAFHGSNACHAGTLRLEHSPPISVCSAAPSLLCSSLYPCTFAKDRAKMWPERSSLRLQRLSGKFGSNGGISASQRCRFMPEHSIPLSIISSDMTKRCMVIGRESSIADGRTRKPRPAGTLSVQGHLRPHEYRREKGQEKRIKVEKKIPCSPRPANFPHTSRVYPVIDARSRTFRATKTGTRTINSSCDARLMNTAGRGLPILCELSLVLHEPDQQSCPSR